VALEGGRRGSDQNSDGSPVLAAGERRGKARGVSKTWFAQDLGGAAGPARELSGGGRRCVPGSGETGAWPRQGATGSATGEAKGATRAVARLR
jgi:hypothetical protein